MASYVIQELPEGMGNGQSALYPKMQNYTLFDYDKVVETIHQYSPTFTPAVIRGGWTDSPWLCRTYSLMDIARR